MIIPFPVREPTPGERRRTCFRCVHAQFGATETFCTKYQEPVDSELYAARECDSYTEENP